MMKRSISIRALVLAGSLATVTACLILPRSFAAAQTTTQNESSTNRLFRTVQANDLAGVQLAISEGADMQARDRWGMTPTDIAIDRGYYRIAHFLAAARHLSRDRNAPKAASSVAAKSAPSTPLDARKNELGQNARDNFPNVDSLPATDPADILASSRVEEANPFDPAAPAPGSQLHSVQAR